MQAKRTARRFGPRGLTLIELMTAAAISVVAVTVAASVFTALARTRRDAMRLVEIQAAGAVASSELQAQLVNAGYRFPAPAFAVNVRNAVTSLPPGGTAGVVIDATTGCGTGGLAPGTDSVEIVTGRTDIFPGKVAAIDSFPPASPTTDHNIVLESFMPFLTTENGVGVVLFADASGESCLGRVYSGPAGSSPPNINVTMIDRDWNDVTAASGPAGTYPNCPKIGMTVYRFAQRQRYFICAEPNQPDGGGGTSSSLFRQDSQADPAGFTYNTPPNKIQDGLEDLQVSTRVFARSPTMVGQDCTPAVGGGEGFCFCDFSPNSACKLAADMNAPKVTKGAYVSWVSGLRVSVGAIGTRPMATDIPDGGKPQIMDHAVTGASDGLRRVTMDVSLGLPNIVQVLP
jgi:prepilin-type N-terminal cleavage/methylation domain-containing protein